MTDFAIGETDWIDKLGNLRNTIRQELIARQTDQHVAGRISVLDVGCGQGTQALRHLESGRTVVGVEPSVALIAHFEAAAAERNLEVDIRRGGIGDLDRVLGDQVFDVVCAHGLMMYLHDPAQAIAALARHAAPGGLLSVTIKNAHGLAMRPALRGDWEGALAAFDEAVYVNELGVTARAHHLEDVESWLDKAGFEIDCWYGVRVFNDAIAGDVDPPDGHVLDELLDAEEIAGQRDPYRWLGSQIHVIAKERSPR